MLSMMEILTVSLNQDFFSELAGVSEFPYQEMILSALEGRGKFQQ